MINKNRGKGCRKATKSTTATYGCNDTHTRSNVDPAQRNVQGIQSLVWTSRGAVVGTTSPAVKNTVHARY